MHSVSTKLAYYAQLSRFDKPVGILLLLWPTLWALVLAANGMPTTRILLIFIAGVFLMRSAGCVVNDIADRKFDAKVARTRQRPLAAGTLRVNEALLVALVFFTLAFILMLFCRWYTMLLATVGFLLTLIYPYSKRFFPTPQIFLGAAFAWGVPMAFAEVQNQVPAAAWLLYATALIWPFIYDTMYAMVDAVYDQALPIHSSALFFGQRTVAILGCLQIIFFLLLIFVGLHFHLHTVYFISLIPAGVLLIYQWMLIKTLDPQFCFKAFMNNQWVGCVIFLGITLDKLL